MQPKKKGEKWWQFWVSTPRTHDESDSRASIPTKPMSPTNPEQKSWLRQGFIAFAGKGKFDKFIQSVINDARPKGSLMYWQESLLKRFAQEHQISFPINLENVNLVFGADIERSSTVVTDFEKRFYASLFPEEGPTTCRKEHCKRKTIRNNVLCAKHHYEMIKHVPCPWDGPPQLTDEECRFLESESTERGETQEGQVSPSFQIKMGDEIDHFIQEHEIDTEGSAGLLIEPIPKETIHVSGTVICPGCGSDIPFDVEVFGLFGGGDKAHCNGCESEVSFSEDTCEYDGKECSLLIAKPFIEPATGERFQIRYGDISAH